MVVDDESMVEEIIEAHVGDLGCEHASFNDPLSAMAFFRHNYKNIDLAVIDLTMPGMTGNQMAQEMYEMAPDLPIILMTGYLTVDSINPNVSLLLHKPILKAELIEAMKRFLGPSMCVVEEAG